MPLAGLEPCSAQNYATFTLAYYLPLLPCTFPENNPLMQGESMQWIPIKPVPKAHAESRSGTSCPNLMPESSCRNLSLALQLMLQKPVQHSVPQYSVLHLLLRHPELHPATRPASSTGASSIQFYVQHYRRIYYRGIQHPATRPACSTTSSIQQYIQLRPAFSIRVLHSVPQYSLQHPVIQHCIQHPASSNASSTYTCNC